VSQDYPRLRYLEAFPHEENGRTSILLRDPAQISEHMLLVSPEFCRLLPLLDGASLRDIQVELTRQFGRIFPMEPWTQFCADSMKSTSLKASFSACTPGSHRRLPSCGCSPGLSRRDRLSADPVELLEFVSSFYSDPRGAGFQPAASLRAKSGARRAHIDLRSGVSSTPTPTGRWPKAKPDLFVIFGTGHHGLPRCIRSRKRFETPIGVSETDGEFLSALRARLPEGLFAEDLSHRHEHTIEFQLVFLHHLYRTTPPPILPILCSFSYQDGRRAATRRTANGSAAFWTLSVCRKQRGNGSAWSPAWISPTSAHAMATSSAPTSARLKTRCALIGRCSKHITKADAQGFYGYVADKATVPGLRVPCPLHDPEFVGRRTGTHAVSFAGRAGSGRLVCDFRQPCVYPLAVRCGQPAGGLKMRSLREVLWFETKSRRDYVNITPDVQELVTKSGIKEGLCLVNAMHITASVYINDDESD
jgi:hypothetical protein